jgi:ketosteroid isomerase-like protein
MSTSDAESIVLSFVREINAHNIAGLVALMSEDHLFIDSLGACVRGREEMRKAWIGYFFMIPDFTVVCREILHHGDTVALFGQARGTCSVGGRLSPENAWEIPAAWMAVVKNGLIAEWRVYADNEPVRQILSATRNESGQEG